MGGLLGANLSHNMRAFLGKTLTFHNLARNSGVFLDKNLTYNGGLFELKLTLNMGTFYF